MMTPKVFAKAIASIEQNYGLRLDARSVWLRLDDWKRLGRDQMGQKCGRGWQGLRGACKRVPKGGDKDAAIKASKVALADKIRKNKGLRDRNAPKVVVERSKVERIKQSATRTPDITKSLESVVSKKIATELRSHPDRVKVKNLAGQIESINSEKAKDSFSDEDAVGFRKRSQARNKKLDGIKKELQKLYKTVQANKPQTLEDRVKGILAAEPKLERTHKTVNSRRQATKREATSGNLVRLRDSAKEALARDARALLSQGKSVPSSVLKVLGGRIDYNEKGEYKPITPVHILLKNH